MGGPDMGGLKLYGACNGGPGIVRNVPNPALFFPIFPKIRSWKIFNFLTKTMD